MVEEPHADQASNFSIPAEKLDLSKYKHVSDIGGALALLSRVVAAHHPHLEFTGFGLPLVASRARETIGSAGMEGRIKVVAMGNILHDRNLEPKKILIRKAYEALPQGGAFIAIENVIDDARRENAYGLPMSLNMLIEFGDAFDCTGADFRSWCIEAGFSRFELLRLAGPTGPAIAYQ